jgi:C4-dicarboxylate transporter
MQENIKDHIVKLKTNILRARFNLMFMIILTAINILSVVSGNEAFMPFSVTISTFAAKLGVNLSIEQNNDMFLYLASQFRQ